MRLEVCEREREEERKAERGLKTRDGGERMRESDRGRDRQTERQ